MKTLSQFLNTNPPNQESIIARSPSLRWFIYSNVTVFCRCGTSSRCTQPQVVRMRYVPCVSLGRQVQFFLDVYIVAGFVMSWKWLVNALLKKQKKTLAPPGMAIQCAKRRIGLHMVGRPLILLGPTEMFFIESHSRAITKPLESHSRAIRKPLHAERH